MHRAKAFFYVCAGICLLALAYHLGARSAGAQAKDAYTTRIDSLKARSAFLQAARLDSLRALTEYRAALDTLDALDDLGETLSLMSLFGRDRPVPPALSLRVVEIYSKAASDPALLTMLLGDVLGDYVLAKGRARSAPQVTQLVDEALLQLAFLQAVQNRQELLLLRQIAARK
jgi:hypothetical protein